MKITESLPIPDRKELLTFLIGAGCSTNLPRTGPVISAIVRAMTGLRGADLRAFRRFVRFEFLVQTLCDYLNTDPSFLVNLYDHRKTPYTADPNAYHHVFAQILQDTNHAVVTTNFDALIEEAQGSAAKAPAFRDSDFAESSFTVTGRLLKLHGSVHNPGTLCATLDSVAPSGKDKLRVFQSLIATRPLIVVGCGGWYDDVLRVMIDTKALGVPIYWFLHEGKGSGDRWYTLNQVPAEDPVARKPSLRFLHELARRGTRAASDIFLVIGDTQRLLFESLERLGIVTYPQSDIGPRRDSSHLISRELLAWLQSRDPNWQNLLLLSGIHLAYTAEREVLTERLSAQIVLSPGGTRMWEALARPKLASAAYDGDDYDIAVDHARRGATAARDAMASSAVTDPRLVASLIESLTWQVEALRMGDKVSQAMRAMDQAQAEIENLMRVSQIGSLLVRAEASWLTTVGEVHTVRGNLPKARDSYKRAVSAYERGGDLNWLLYARLGVADVDRISGRLKNAVIAYQDIDAEAHLTGWTEWLPAQVFVSHMDAIRVWTALEEMHERLPSGSSARLRYLSHQRMDESLQAPAALLRWEFGWMRRGTPDWTSADKAFQMLRGILISGGKDFAAAARLSHIEVLKWLGPEGLKRAERTARRIVDYAANQELLLLQLYARLELADIARLRGKRSDWLELAGEFAYRECWIGLVYALLLGLSIGEDAPEDLTRLASQKLQKQGLFKALRRLSTGTRQETPLRFAFPGTLTVY